jgi:FK506-binding nuclear protein
LRYIGKLKNGKIFDSNTKGKPFSLHLGKGEVIKGWDVGLAGMKVGGERRITVPPNMAYGTKGLPDIPANSELIFECKNIPELYPWSILANNFIVKLLNVK